MHLCTEHHSLASLTSNMLQTFTLAYTGAKSSRHLRPAPQESITLHVASPGKDQTSKFELWFLLNVYCFCTIMKLTICKLNHLKSGTIRIRIRY